MKTILYSCVALTLLGGAGYLLQNREKGAAQAAPVTASAVEKTKVVAENKKLDVEAIKKEVERLDESLKKDHEELLKIQQDLERRQAFDQDLKRLEEDHANRRISDVDFIREKSRLLSLMLDAAKG